MSDPLLSIRPRPKAELSRRPLRDLIVQVNERARSVREIAGFTESDLSFVATDEVIAFLKATFSERTRIIVQWDDEAWQDYTMVSFVNMLRVLAERLNQKLAARPIEAAAILYQITKGEQPLGLTDAQSALARCASDAEVDRGVKLQAWISTKMG